MSDGPLDSKLGNVILSRSTYFVLFSLQHPKIWVIYFRVVRTSEGGLISGLIYVLHVWFSYRTLPLEDGHEVLLR